MRTRFRTVDAIGSRLEALGVPRAYIDKHITALRAVRAKKTVEESPPPRHRRHVVRKRLTQW
jgi:hypothetical protein